MNEFIPNSIEYQHCVLALAQFTAPADRPVVVLNVSLHLDGRHAAHVDQGLEPFAGLVTYFRSATYAITGSILKGGYPGMAG